MDIFDGIEKLKPYLDYTWTRHKVILSNIANADTPNYRAKDVVFNVDKDTLPLKVTRPLHMEGQSGKSFRVFEIQRTLVGNDFNNVSIEEEMAKLTQNRIAYEVYMRMASSSAQELLSIIREGR
ncbi:flagellar basal-body rod protein FlgB [Thermocrinis minervae]|uniref:Flagellar basal body rod protein FlgB n=2 Tax=Thermocrinis minervae TaxID=381751 RepID=A0A1M6SKQ4_9AQUI|nr:flagellar basal-body rod protein FlgB [Thermocrinis minervae]